MSIFKNFIVVVVMVGILTRIANYFFNKYIYKRETAICVSSITTGIIVCSIASAVIGFDVVISEYVIAFIMWFIFDLMRIDVKQKG